jgi:hypothetical protein
VGCTPIDNVTERQAVLKIALRMGGPGSEGERGEVDQRGSKVCERLSALLVGKHARFRALTMLPSCPAFLYAARARQ